MTEAYSEARTRQQLIGPRALGGWDVKDLSQATVELGIDLTKSKPGKISEPRFGYECHQFADCALLLKGKSVAVVGLILELDENDNLNQG